MIKPLRKNTAKKAPFKLNWAQKLFIVAALIILSITSLPIVIVLLIGMLPTVTVLLIDSRNFNKLTMVGCFNLAGAFVCLVSMFNQFNNLSEITVLGNVFNIIIMLGAAALGMLLYFELPNLFVYLFKSSAQRRLRHINATLEKISADWGSEIVNDVSK